MEDDIQEGENIIGETANAPTERSVQDGQSGVERSVDDGRAEAEPPSPVQMDAQYGKRNHDHNLRPRKRPNFQHLHAMFHMQVALITEQMSAKKGLKLFGKQGAEAIIAEMNQVHYRKVIKPVMARNMTREEKRAALHYLMFLKQKRCGKIKARGCADGRKQRLWKTKEETSAPTVRTESVILSCAIDAKEGRKVMTVDVPGAFMHADIDELVHVKFEGELAELLMKVDEKLYRKYMTTESVRGKTKKVIYVELTKALYGTLQGALLFWKNLSSFLISELGFKLNPYDSCVANKTIKGKQCTILWHVDDLKISHVDEKVLEKIARKLDKKYGTKDAPLTVNRGSVHEYLGMTIDYTTKGAVQFRMTDFIDGLLEEAAEDMRGTANSPAYHHLFKVNPNAKRLDEKKADYFHHMTAKLLYLCKRTRADIMTAVAFLTTRVSAPDEDDYRKLARCIKYLRATKDLTLTLEFNDSGTLEWWVDAAFAVHKDMKSHTGAVLTMGKGGVFAISRKQKINTTSSTTAELVGVSDALPLVIWTRKFLEAQGFKVTDNIVYQDNQSAMLLEQNGKRSSGKNTRHLDIRYFYCTDQINGDEKTMSVHYCPTGEMLGDFMTKPLQGSQFKKLRALILNIKPDQPATSPKSDRPEECVETRTVK